MLIVIDRHSVTVRYRISTCRRFPRSFCSLMSSPVTCFFATRSHSCDAHVPNPLQPSCTLHAPINFHLFTAHTVLPMQRRSSSSDFLLCAFPTFVFFDKGRLLHRMKHHIRTPAYVLPASASALYPLLLTLVMCTMQRIFGLTSAHSLALDRVNPSACLCHGFSSSASCSTSTMPPFRSGL